MLQPATIGRTPGPSRGPRAGHPAASPAGPHPARDRHAKGLRPRPGELAGAGRNSPAAPPAPAQAAAPAFNEGVAVPVHRADVAGELPADALVSDMVKVHRPVRAPADGAHSPRVLSPPDGPETPPMGRAEIDVPVPPPFRPTPHGARQGRTNTDHCEPPRT